ncbi:MAG: 1-acyl-sn-glycerol-3-phosphate acyltransferase [Phycisphaerae bacterium]|nr:1-acyl-sn-glycerol-3-phosphate acyltransferase [Phycisphaerae bacterium]
MTELLAKIILYLCRLVSGVQVEIRDVDLFSGTVIFYANHSSHLDAMVILSLLPEERRKKTFIVGSKKYWQANAIRRYISNSVFRTVMIDRAGESNTSGAFAALSEMSKVLEQDCSIIIFPEGTRSSEGTISDFKRGIYHIAKKNSDIKLVPVYLENMNRIMPKGELIIIPLLGRVVFGKSITLLEGEDKEAFLARARNELVDLGGNSLG